MKEIAIITGGDSSEYEISIQSANVVFNHLDKTKYNPTIIHVKDNIWTNYHTKEEINTSDFSINTKDGKVVFDYVFMALHGPPSENGELQTYFDKLNIAYSSCNSEVSALTFNKIECNKQLSNLGFRCAKSLHYKKGDKINTKHISETLKLPLFIKPNEAGSSFGVSKVTTENDIEKAINNALLHDDMVLMEQFIDGTEVSCGVMVKNSKVTSLPITEIVSQNDFFDFQAKYEGLSEEITPARISKDLTENIQKITESVFVKMNLRGICRIDFIIMEEVPYIIEINSIPGLSEESIIPKQAKEAGISLSELFDRCIENTIK